MLDRRTEAWGNAQTKIDEQTVMDYVVDDVAQAKCVDPIEFFDELTDYLENPPSANGATMPWHNTHDKVRFRPKETTLWAGISGHGKSLLIGQIVIGLIAQGEKVMVISLEMSPESTLFRMMVQCCGSLEPTHQYKDAWLSEVRHNLRMVDHEGPADPELLYACIRYAKAIGCQHVVIDNLGYCVAGTDDYNAQKNFVVRLHELAKSLNLHVHLVHHVKKLEDELKMPGKFDLHGGVSVTNFVSQCVIVYRNRLKEKKCREPNPKQDDLDMPDCVLNVVKNREGQWEGVIPLWFVPGCKQFVASSKKRAMNLLPSVMPANTGVNASQKP